METQTSNSNIRKTTTTSPLTVSKVSTTQYQKSGTQTAELRQAVTTKSYYPTKSISNDLQDNIFSMSDFGFEEKEYSNTENRVAWIDVPTGINAEQVSEKLKAMPKACLYRVLSNHPVLSNSDRYAINSAALNVTKDDYADKQVVRYPENHPQAGQIAPDSNGKVQYRRIAFSATETTDSDQRTVATDDYYASASIARELNGGATAQIQSQSIN